jgi:hypothetical protein
VGPAIRRQQARGCDAVLASPSGVGRYWSEKTGTTSRIYAPPPGAFRFALSWPMYSLSFVKDSKFGFLTGSGNFHCCQADALVGHRLRPALTFECRPDAAIQV